MNFEFQKYLLEQRAITDVDGGTFLNEDYDMRSVSFDARGKLRLPLEIVVLGKKMPVVFLMYIY